MSFQLRSVTPFKWDFRFLPCPVPWLELFLEIDLKYYGIGTKKDSDWPVRDQESWLLAKDLGPGPNREPEPSYTRTACTESRPRDMGVSQMGPQSRLVRALNKARWRDRTRGNVLKKKSLPTLPHLLFAAWSGIPRVYSQKTPSACLLVATADSTSDFIDRDLENPEDYSGLVSSTLCLFLLPLNPQIRPQGPCKEPLWLASVPRAFSSFCAEIYRCHTWSLLSGYFDLGGKIKYFKRQFKN